MTYKGANPSTSKPPDTRESSLPARAPLWEGTLSLASLPEHELPVVCDFTPGRQTFQVGQLSGSLAHAAVHEDELCEVKVSRAGSPILMEVTLRYPPGSELAGGLAGRVRFFRAAPPDVIDDAAFTPHPPRREPWGSPG